MLSKFATILVSIICILSYVKGQLDNDRPSQMILPPLGIGTAGLREETGYITYKSLELGVRLIDTAQAEEWYDEKRVGDAILEFEEVHPHLAGQAIIVTKIHPRWFQYEKMNEQLEESSRNFGGREIDVVLLHSPYCWRGHCTAEEEKINWKEAWRNLEELKDPHRIRAIGVSNFEVDLLSLLVLEISNRKVSVVQNWMDPYHQDVATRRFAKDHGIQYMAYSSFGTQWNGKVSILNDPVLSDIANGHNTTVTQIIISWLCAEEVVAIPRTGTLEHLQQNLEACSTSNICKTADASCPIPLTDADLALIRSLDGTHGTPWD